MKTVIGIYGGEVVRLNQPLDGGPGTRVLVSVEPLSPTWPFKERSVREVGGILKHDGPARTLEEMEEGLEQRLREVREIRG